MTLPLVQDKQRHGGLPPPGRPAHLLRETRPDACFPPFISLTAPFLPSPSPFVLKPIPICGKEPSPPLFQLRVRPLPFDIRILERVACTRNFHGFTSESSGTVTWLLLWTVLLEVFLPRSSVTLVLTCHAGQLRLKVPIAPSKRMEHSEARSFCFRDSVFA